MAAVEGERSVDVDCAYLETELLQLQPDTRLEDYFGLEAEPGDEVVVNCSNCSLKLRARIGRNVTMAVYSDDPDGLCVRLRSDPDAS